MKKTHIHTSAVIAAGGCGTRMKSRISKQFIMLDDKPIIAHTLDVFERCSDIDEIIIVCAENDIEKINDIIISEGTTKVSDVVKGGKTRQDSVRNGLSSAHGDIILIHDAVRPFVTEKQIQDVIAAAEKFGAAALCHPITDTVKRIDDDYMTETLNRSELVTVQTPQGFRSDIIRAAHNSAFEKNISATDDCALCEISGTEVRIVRGNNLNIKITMPEDLIVAKGILHSRKLSKGGSSDIPNMPLKINVPRIGMGYDVHRLVDDRPLILGGVEIPYEKGLLGHSDADVLLHAIMDAMLGAAALGDIGKHFPDTDKKWKGADSCDLLYSVKNIIKENGYSIANIDATIIAQQPKLMPFIPEMQKKISEILSISPNCVSVKATTTEKLGFCGRGEGIAAEAICAII